MATTTDSEASGLTALPPELVTSIVAFVYPPSLVDLACSCKFLAECSRDDLRNHRDAHAKYRVCTDVLPTTLPDLLRKALVDPMTAWHVRELEYCYSRKDWAHWKKFEFEIEESSNRRGKPAAPDYAFTQDERTRLLDCLREDFHFEESDIDKAREDLEGGSDAPLKLLVFALCPRISSLKFSRHLWLRGRTAFEDPAISNPRAISRSNLDYIQHAILQCLRHSESAWPVGLSSLREIAVGVETGTEIDELRPESAPHLCADIMKLPNIKSIYFDGLTQDIQQMIDDDDGYGNVPPYDIAQSSSSIENIFLNRANGLGRNFRDAMTEGCKELKSFTISESDMDDIDTLIPDCYTLMFYKTAGLHGYRCNMFRPEEVKDYTRVRTLYVDASDVMLDAYYNCDDEAKTNLDDNDHEWIHDRDFFVKFFMNDCFPENIEVLVLGSMDSRPIPEGDADFFDEAIATMIEYSFDGGESAGEEASSQDDEISNTSRQSFERRFVNLKAIYLGGTEEINVDPRRNETRPPPREKRWFSRAIAAGRKAGVDVHTRTTRGQAFHEIDFPTPPSVADLKSAPEPPQQPLVFDVYTGRWRNDTCGNCGLCESCLHQYDASVWREVEEEMAQAGA